MNKLLSILTLPLTLFCLTPVWAQSVDNTIQLPNGDILSTLSILPNGDFSEGMDGWSASGYVGARPDNPSIQWKNRFEVREDKGATLLRLLCLDPDGKDFAVTTSEDIPLPSDRKFRTLLFSYRYRIAQLKLGELNFHTLRFGLSWHDPDGKMIEDSVIEFRKNVPVWTDQEKQMPIPKGATFARLRIHFLAANGIIDVTNLKLQPLSTQR
jgi:hypothetical protein